MNMSTKNDTWRKGLGKDETDFVIYGQGQSLTVVVWKTFLSYFVTVFITKLSFSLQSFIILFIRRQIVEKV